ncbi:MAG: hypothetical protein WCQ64_15355 [Acidobacteriota bacterium]
MSDRVPRHLVAIEVAGFMVIIAAVWVDELWDLPRYLFGATPTPFRPEEAIVESALVIALCALVVSQSLRILRRVRRLESMITMCAWCRRVHHDGEWMQVEKFLKEHESSTSHGICPECAARALADSTPAGG